MRQLYPIQLFAYICLLAVQYQIVLGQYTGQVFSENEVGKIISPQISDLHLNQPSVFKGYAVLAGNAVHEIWDISDPYKPSFVSRLTSKHKNGEAESHQVSYMADKDGNYFLVTTSGKGIDIWNITDPTNPQYSAALELPNISYGDVSNGVWGVSCQGNYIYVGATNNGLYVVDATDKANPKLVKTLPISKLSNVFPGPVFALGNILIITPPKNKTGIVTVDISDSDDPVMLDSYTSTKKSYIGGFYGKYAFLEQDISIFDVTTDPTNIQFIGANGGKKSEYMSFDAGYLFLGGLRGGTQGIYKYDLSDINNPTEILRIKGRDSRWDDQFSCTVGNIILIADDQRVDGKYVGGVIGIHNAQPDQTGPTVEAIFPKNNTQNQPKSTKIGISLSDWIEPSSLDKNSVIVRPVGGDPIDGSWGCTYTTINFEPAEQLLPNTIYEIVLNTNGITDLVGNGVANTYISTFSTGELTAEEEKEEEETAYVAKLAPITPIELNQAVNWSVENPVNEKTYIWELGDGSILTGESVQYTFKEAGRFPVTLKVYGETTNTNNTGYFEAESANLSGVIIESSNAGYSGSGYGDFPVSQGNEIYLEWTTARQKATYETLTIQYASSKGAGARALNLRINNGDPILVNFPPTNSWSDYQEISFDNIPLLAGINNIKLTADAGAAGPNIDYIKLSGEGSSLPGNIEQSIPFIQIVHHPLTSSTPQSNTQILVNESDIWAVNSDAHTVTSIDRNTLEKKKEILVGKKPVSLALVNENELWVVNKDSWDISIVDPQTQTLTSSINLPMGCQPSAIVVHQDQSVAYVTSEVLGEVYEIATQSKQINRTLKIDTGSGMPVYIGGLALDPSGNKLYISRLISEGKKGEVFLANTQSFDTYTSIPLEESKGEDGNEFARGIPNYLTQVAISPDGKYVWLPSKKDNISRGQFRDGQPLEHDNTVRAITSIIHANTDQEWLNKRIDIDNSDRCHSVTFSPLGDIAFISLPSNNEIYVVDVNTQLEVARLPTEEIPVFTSYDPVYKRLYSLNFLGRSVSIFDISDIIEGNSGYELLKVVSTVEAEPLSPKVLQGKKLFYDATSAKVAQDGYLSCASCHLDGGSDGQIWDLTSLEEGLRNTIDLRGKSGMGHGRLHWTANFDEVHDFEIQIRLLNSGTGLMDDADFENSQDPFGNPKAGLSEELDALAEYISSLSSFPESPYKNEDGSISSEALAGLQIFNQLECFNCHSGEDYTNSEAGYLYDVGTLKSSSGKRMGSTLLGLDVPTLKGLWFTAPYLHDGSAATLREVLTTHNANGAHTDVSNLSNQELDELISFLKQIDDQTTATSNSALELHIDFPQANEQYTGPNIPIDISFNIPQIKYIEYYVNGELIDIQDQANFYGNWSNAVDGFHTIEAKAYFGKGNTAIVSQCVDIEVVNTCTSPDSHTCSTNLNIIALLEGRFSKGSMTTDLTELIPLTDPYVGTVTVDEIPMDVVDWVLVQFRDATNYKSVISQYPAFLKADGQIIGTKSPDNTLSLQSVPSTSYIAVLHRNHLPVITSAPVSPTLPIDFSDPNTPVMGNGARAIADGKAMLYIGDYNGNGLINNLDFNAWKTNAALIDDYHPADGDGNGIINNLDFNLWKRNRARTGIPGVALRK